MNQPLQQTPEPLATPPKPRPRRQPGSTNRAYRSHLAHRVGELGEATAAQFYRDEGYRILARNVRYPVGELDVIARAPDPSGTIVFIEVKTRTTLDFGIAEAVTPRKLHRMHRAAYRWLTERHVPWSEVRFDVVAIYLDPTGLASVQRYIGVDDGAR